MSQILTVYVEQLKSGRYRGVPRALKEGENKDHCECRKSGRWFCRHHKYEWYNADYCNNRDVIAVLTDLSNYIDVEPVPALERPDHYSPELQPIFDGGEFPYTIVSLSGLLSYDFTQLVSRFNEPDKYPLSEPCSGLLDMIKRVQQAVGTTPPEDVRLMICVD